MKYSCLREKLAQKRLTAKVICAKTGVSKYALSHYLSGRRKKTGRANCRAIDDFLIGHGLIHPRKKPRVIAGNAISAWAIRRVVKDFGTAAEFQRSQETGIENEAERRPDPM